MKKFKFSKEIELQIPLLKEGYGACALIDFCQQNEAGPTRRLVRDVFKWYFCPYEDSRALVDYWWDEPIHVRKRRHGLASSRVNTKAQEERAIALQLLAEILKDQGL